MYINSRLCTLAADCINLYVFRFLPRYYKQGMFSSGWNKNNKIACEHYHVPPNATGGDPLNDEGRNRNESKPLIHEMASISSSSVANTVMPLKSNRGHLHWVTLRQDVFSGKYASHGKVKMLRCLFNPRGWRFLFFCVLLLISRIREAG